MEQNDIAKQLERCEAKLVQFVLTQDQEYENQKEEITRLKARNEKLERVLIEAERYVMGRTIFKTELGKAIEAARSGE
jgi:hypothetical protein